MKLRSKIAFTLLFQFLFISSFAQSYVSESTKTPTEYGEFIFPLWSKIELELKETTNGKYEYRTLSIEPFTEMYSMDKNENLYTKNPKPNTIEIIFTGAFYNDGKEDKDYKSLLKI
jgi:hypothetical protein